MKSRDILRRRHYSGEFARTTEVRAIEVRSAQVILPLVFMALTAKILTQLDAWVDLAYPGAEPGAQAAPFVTPTGQLGAMPTGETFNDYIGATWIPNREAVLINNLQLESLYP